ncbi:CDGSH iron-sulfur domain-containing protein [Streptomyces sp. NPDC005385]|uniref:CDGSH iron-sulfur domain-containing protein n=1 Tax=Streptomyces sp. NPDC005385 TaxID=3157039 RepID=UPI0033B7EAD2
MARRVHVDPEGPVLVEGPVEIVLDDGTVARSERFTVAICTCRRSRTFPWCDTSHRRRSRATSAPEGRDSQPQHEHTARGGGPATQDRNSR